MDPKIIGVILAAGKGTRIYPFSEILPKCILPVCNRPLLEYHIETMKLCGISDVIIVIGHLGYAIVDALGDGSRFGTRIRYIEQKETLGLAHALGRIEPYVDLPFLLFLGDVYFTTHGDLRPIMEEVLSGHTNAILLSKVETNPEMIRRNFAIIEDSADRVCRVIEKPRYLQTRLKGCGLYIFDQHIFDAIRRTPRTAMRDEYEITESIQIMINDGLVVRHRPLIKHDVNLTVPSDLLGINLIELADRRLKKLVGENVRLAQGVKVDNSIIGDGVVVHHPIRVSNSVIFPGSQLESEFDLDHTIVDGTNHIQCHNGALP